ncbi:hypothetical protein FNF27_06328 [Cafeteria roenbergensis]|uniref:Uncharacterized protein n=2 Tax=Cafeteria roenbergensis TaxID=33653 RepID=A0A5A8E250_CAFRO|nr:hypothetical protein FNF27_06328 [Cafeteria roenbergensis]
MFASAHRASRALRTAPAVLACASAGSFALAQSEGDDRLPSFSEAEHTAIVRTGRPAVQRSACASLGAGPVLAASAVADEDIDDLASSSSLDDDVQITDDDIPGRKKALVRLPSASQFAKGLVSVVRLPWDIVTGAIDEDGNEISAPSVTISADGEEVEVEEELPSSQDVVLSYDDIDNVTNIAPHVKSKPIELVLMRSLKRGAGADTFGDAPITDAWGSITRGVSSLMPRSLFARKRVWFHEGDSASGDTLLEDTDVTGDTTPSKGSAAVAAAAAGAKEPGSEEDDDDLDMGDVGSGASMLVQINAGLGTAPRTQGAPGDGLDLMVVPLLVMGRWTAATNCQRFAGASTPILIPNVRRSGGRNDLSLQAVIFPKTGNPMMPSGLVSTNLGCKIRGSDFTLEYSAALDSRKEDEHSLTYFQTVLPSVALGTSVTAEGGSFLSALPSTFRYGAMAAYTPDGASSTWMARYNPADADGVVRVRHFREVNEKAKLMTEVAVREDMSSEMVAAIELPLRQEPFMRDPYTVLKAAITSAGKLSATLEHSLAMGSDCMGRLEIGASVDAATDTNTVSVGYMLQA